MKLLELEGTLEAIWSLSSAAHWNAHYSISSHPLTWDVYKHGARPPLWETCASASLSVV